MPLKEKTLKDTSSKKRSSKKCKTIEGGSSNVEGDQKCTLWIKKKYWTSFNR